MNTNIQVDFQICISVPLSRCTQLFFCLFEHLKCPFSNFVALFIPSYITIIFYAFLKILVTFLCSQIMHGCEVLVLNGCEVLPMLIKLVLYAPNFDAGGLQLSIFSNFLFSLMELKNDYFRRACVSGIKSEYQENPYLCEIFSGRDTLMCKTWSYTLLVLLSY